MTNQPYQQPAPIYINNNIQKPKMKHGIHIVLTVLTLGAWAPIWLIIWLIKR